MKPPHKLAVCSIFRNATLHINRYLDQVDAFIKHQGWESWQVKLLLGYGDSVDGTGPMLFEECQFRFDAVLIEANHGGAHYGSIEDHRRFKQLAQVGNKVWSQIPPEAEVVAMIESDLIWEPHVLSELVRDARTFNQVFAPMIMHKEPPLRFYDTWGYRKDGVRFVNNPPFHECLLEPRTHHVPIKMDTVGSFVVMPGHVAGRVEFTPEEVVVGLCKQIYEKTSATILLQPELTVYHP
jgi:hypothetical protein